jgi:hypothetical protein
VKSNKANKEPGKEAVEADAMGKCLFIHGQSEPQAATPEKAEKPIKKASIFVQPNRLKGIKTDTLFLIIK